MRRGSLFALVGLLALFMAGCGTVKGMGEDLSTVGHWLTRGSDTVKSPDTARPSVNK